MTTTKGQEVQTIDYDDVPTPSQLVYDLNRVHNVTAISNMTGISRSTLHAWMRGDREPNWHDYVTLLYSAGYYIVK